MIDTLRDFDTQADAICYVLYGINQHDYDVWEKKKGELELRNKEGIKTHNLIWSEGQCHWETC